MFHLKITRGKHFGDPDSTHQDLFVWKCHSFNLARLFFLIVGTKISNIYSIIHKTIKNVQSGRKTKNKVEMVRSPVINTNKCSNSFF